MKYIQLGSTNPYYNLAAEEFVLYNMKDDAYFLLWQNDNTVVVGRHQNVVEEVDVNRAEELGVRIVRRNSGGGAVYHDPGNLNFSFITDWVPDRHTNLDIFLEPVIDVLAELGVTAEKHGRNDLVAGGRKISGNAQYIHGGRLLHHGTLLVCSNLSRMPEVLRPQTDKIVSKGIKSVRGRVGNICEFSKSPITVETLIDALKAAILSDCGTEGYVFTGEQSDRIERLAKEKYETWEWNFGSSADYSYKNSRRFPGGKIEVRLDVENGVIGRCRVFGDFLAIVGVEELESAVTGCRASRSDLGRALAGFDLPRYYGFTLAEFLECFDF